MQLYEIAYQLRMPVSRLVEEVPYEELQGWVNYFERRPVGWRDDYRAVPLLKIQGFKGNPGDVFPSIRAIERDGRSADEDGRISLNALKGSMLFSKMLTAEGGDKLEFLNAEN